MIWVIIGVLALGVGLFFFLRHKASHAVIVPVLPPLPVSDREDMAVFCPWMERDEAVIAKHALYIDVAEAYDMLWGERYRPRARFPLYFGTDPI